MTLASITESGTPSLELHLIGGGQGESIVIRTPDGRWGVVDCFTSTPNDPNSNPTALFLRARGVKELQFVCLTHPHQDHYMGMVKLIEEFRPREFWRFGCLSHEHITNLIQYYELRAIQKGRSDFTRTAEELLGLFELILKGAESGAMQVVRGGARTTLYPPSKDEPNNCHIICLSPTGNQVERYEAAILRCIGADGRIANKLTRTQHNNISLVMKIIYGETSIFLGADMERDGWAGCDRGMMLFVVGR